MDQLSLFAAREADAAADAGPPLPDAAARRRIETDLGTSLIVEAGAGAGKTTAMVGRMVALVRSGTARAGELAAVTFTRKAAAELRERFQTALERELRVAVGLGDAAATQLIDAALREIDRAFLGTIHGFCARLLRERPLDAGIDPTFRETLGAEEQRLRSRFWHSYLESLAVTGDPVLDALRDVGLAPAHLQELFEELSRQPDVSYPASLLPRPDAAPRRRAIERIMDRAAGLMPAEEPYGGWDRLQATLRMLRFHRFVIGWSHDATFLDAVAPLGPAAFRATKKKWPDGDAAKAIEGELCSLFADGGAINDLLSAWWAFRYPIAIDFARNAAAAYERERLTAGTLNFQDLLMLAARLLRESPAARRELSERYRFLLVDEFQDTDPIQAEVLFLLASDEELHLFADTPGAGGSAAWRPPFASWRHLTPRPGALFVVGDPKQSIYRFRRADMTLYQQVRRRFDVVELTSNFRSRPAIERFVNETFESRFPEDSSDVQARYAPMRVRPRGGAGDGRVCWYELDDPVHGRVPQLARQDADRLATWISQRVQSGERRPGDFLLLTPNTKWLGRYAAALETRNIPVQVTGAGVGGPDTIELDELRLLLRSLCDPGDASLTVATLVGLFFGIDYDQLALHAGSCGRAPFSFTAAWPEPADAVQRALALLHRFWLLSRQQPADVALERIVDELGALPFAAAGELGESRAGALLFALDAVRAAAINGDASLAGAVAALDAALDEGDSEAPLEPGRTDVVRVMNLHKAKGLEATVVILAMPFGDWSPPPRSRVVRDETGSALGYIPVVERRGPNHTVTIAQPPDWDAHAAEEQRFDRAEGDRLLYVAATRAAEELVIGCAYNANSPSPWRSFHEWLQQHAPRLELPQPVRGARHELATTGAQLQQTIMAVDAARAAHRRPTYRVAPVSRRKLDIAAVDELALDEMALDEMALDEMALDEMALDGRGTDWGSAVHEGLQYAAEGLTGDALRAACRNRLVALQRPIGSDGEPTELGELLTVIAAVRASPLWRRAAGAARMLVEVPFALSLSAVEYAALLGLPAPAADDPAHELIDGRIDLVFREEGGWVIVDYKSDAAGAAIPAGLKARYDAQLKLYAAAWQRITGEAVAETALLFTADVIP